MNRLTISLEDDLYAMARSHAIANKTSISKAVGDLLRRRRAVLGIPASPGGAIETDDETGFYIDPETLLPVVRGSGKPLTSDDVQRSAEDDDIRHLESAGLHLLQPQQ